MYLFYRQGHDSNSHVLPGTSILLNFSLLNFSQVYEKWLVRIVTFLGLRILFSALNITWAQNMAYAWNITWAQNMANALNIAWAQNTTWTEQGILT
jgi:hypothetical protein